jgi:hypothetical protein
MRGMMARRCRLRPGFVRARRSRANYVPIGLAPNLEVSLVVTPDDAALLAKRTGKFYVYEF